MSQKFYLLGILVCLWLSKQKENGIKRKLYWEKMLEILRAAVIVLPSSEDELKNSINCKGNH